MARNNSKEAESAFLVAFLIILVLWLIAYIQLKVIHLARFFFWFFFILIFVSLVVGIIYFIRAIIDDWDKGLYFGIGALSILVFFISIFIVSKTYDYGYSQEALRREAELKGKLQEYEELMGLFSLHERLTEEIMDAEIEALCISSPDSCESIKMTYQTYQNIKGAKDLADKIMFFKQASGYATQ